MDGLHSTVSMILLGNRYFLTILPVRVLQITKLWSSSPDARYKPFGLIAIDLTVVRWKLNSIETYVGNGFRSFGEGSSGISLLGSVTLTFFLRSLGHK